MQNTLYTVHVDGTGLGGSLVVILLVIVVAVIIIGRKARFDIHDFTLSGADHGSEGCNAVSTRLLTS